MFFLYVLQTPECIDPELDREMHKFFIIVT